MSPEQQPKNASEDEARALIRLMEERAALLRGRRAAGAGAVPARGLVVVLALILLGMLLVGGLYYVAESLRQNRSPAATGKP